MPGKTTRRRATARRPEAEVVAADSAIARVVDRAFENPAMSGGLMIMAITAMAIMSNALFLQAGRHPEPLFATRPAAAPQAAPSAQVPRAAPAERTVANVPVPQTREAASAAAQPPAAAPTPADANKVLITAVQRELARLGIYTGAIDGLFGPRTKAAIATWQTAAGVDATGEPTPELLAALRKPVAAARPSAAPIPAVVRQAASADQVAAAVARAEELEREQKAATLGRKMREVQVALNQIGYGPLSVDGQPSRPTGDAIRRFQLDNGLPVTGELNEKVVQRLVGIGAMKSE